MARTFTAADLLTRCKERADMESTNFISDAEWYRYMSASYTELYDMLVKAQPDFYLEENLFSTTSGTSDYACPSDYYGDMGVDYKDGNTYTELNYISGIERNNYDYSNGQGPSSGYHFVYNTSTPSTPMIRLLPSPSTGEVYRQRYLVAPQEITTSTATVDGVSGWEEYIVLDCAVKALTKEESPTGALERQLERMRMRIIEMVENRTIAEAGHVVDARRTQEFYWDPSDFWRNRP